MIAKRIGKKLGGIFFAGFAIMLISPTLAFSLFEEPHHHETNKQGTVIAKSTDVKVIAEDLFDQNGNPVNFKRDVIKGRVVAINFIYTSCKTACPIQNTIFTHLQESQKKRLGKEVFLITISIDPNVDDPERLKAFSKKYESKAGWFWLTGSKRSVDRVLLGLGAYSPDLDEHPSTILIGDGRRNIWTRYYGFPKLEKLSEKIDELIDSQLSDRQGQ